MLQTTRTGHIIGISLVFLTTVFLFWRFNTDREVITETFQKRKKDTLLIQPQDTNSAYPRIFEEAFGEGLGVNNGLKPFGMKRKAYGEIIVKSGELLVCDPIVEGDAKALIYDFPCGSFPVELAVTNVTEYPVNAYCRVVFSNQHVAHWELALRPGEEPLDIWSDDFYCFGVDAGRAIIADNQGGNSVSFDTGEGDGCYAVYIGYDHEGKICRLLVDFQLVEWWEHPPVSVSGKTQP